MEDSGKIPITNKKTGETELGHSAKSLMKRKQANQSDADPDAASKNEDRREDAQRNAPGSNAGSEAVPQADAGQTKRKVKENKKPQKDVESLEQFIAQAYTRPGQRISLKPKVEEILAKDPKLSDEARARLLELAAGDWMLVVPGKLLLVMRNIKRFPPLKNEMYNFVGAVLEAHPVFRSLGLVGVLKNLPDAPDLQKAMMLIAERDLPEALSDHLDEKPKPKQCEELRINTINCLALWAADTRGLSFEKLVQSLNSAFWSRRAEAIKADTDMFRMLLEIRDIRGIGLVCSTFKKMADIQSQSAMAAEMAKNAAQGQVETLQAKAVALREEIEIRGQEVAQLKDELEKQKKSHLETRTHLQDDLEHMRSRVLRRLKGEVSLLDEGLHALRREDPKLHVVEDHAERVLDGLKKEIKELESGG